MNEALNTIPRLNWRVTPHRLPKAGGGVGHRTLLLVSVLCPLLASGTPPEPEPALPALILTSGPVAGALTLHSEVLMQPRHYYTLLQSSNLVGFDPIRMARATAAVTTKVWDVPVSVEAEPQLFWFTRELSIYEPADSDHDGLDDVFELGQLGLDPLNPADAKEVPAGGSNSWLEIYRTQYGRSNAATNAVSREVSIFNLEPLKFRFEATSREVSVFNLQVPPNRIEAISREVSVNVPTD